MTDTQHTPGPWTYSEGTRTIRGPQNHWLASMDSWDGAIDHAANARLISAAPTMLAALLNTTDALDQLMREGTLKIGHPYAPHVRNIIDNARAAIAKATGE